MKILITPEDIVKRCSWDNYVYYILGSDKEGEKILKENKEFEISERDALIIGILKVIETDNLIHKFNTFIVDLLTNKSINNQNQILIRKKTLSSAIDKFLDKFPVYWESDSSYKKGIKDLEIYMEEIKNGIEKLEITQVTDQFGTYDFLNSNSIKKLLSFNY
jgi:hypothetical protein